MDNIAQRYAEIMQDRCRSQQADIELLHNLIARLTREKRELAAEIMQLKTPKVIVKERRKKL